MMRGRGTRRSLTVGVAVAVPIAIAIAMWGVPVAISQVDGCTDREIELGPVKAGGCWTVTGNTYTTTRPVDLNGFTVTPSANAPFSIDTDQRLATTNGRPVGLAAKPLDYQNTPLEFGSI